MSSFFLSNNAINNVASYDEFKTGILELHAIEKQPSHTFYKNDSVYSLQIIIEGLFTANTGKDEQEIFRFLEHLSPCENLIESELDADTYCNSSINGFLGINFNNVQIIASKQVKNSGEYKKWCFAFQSNNDTFFTKSIIAPEKKKVHLSDHHGKKELKDLCDKIKNSPYVEEMHSTNWGGKQFIRSFNANGYIEIVLHKSEREYALNVKTTGKDILETEAIAEILRSKYDK